MSNTIKSNKSAAGGAKNPLVTISLKMPTSLRVRVDKAAQSLSISRSAYIKLALSNALSASGKD